MIEQVARAELLIDDGAAVRPADKCGDRGYCGQSQKSRDNRHREV